LLRTGSLPDGLPAEASLRTGKDGSQANLTDELKNLKPAIDRVACKTTKSLSLDDIYALMPEINSRLKSWKSSAPIPMKILLRSQKRSAHQ